MKNDVKRNALCAIVTLILCVFVAIDVYKSPNKPQVYGPEWNQVFDFVQTADKVETVATTYGGFEFEHPPTDILGALTKYDPTGHHMVRQVQLVNRKELIQIIRKAPDTSGGTPACFCPHHYVVASKAKQQIVISMCYSCELIGVTGAIKASANLRSDTAEDVSKYFGLDVFPFLDKKCYFNQGIYDTGMADYGINGPANPAK